ncbi:hypothetical protein HDU86_006093 [Geranomyces michiganensis]|nr:hypothetical protein HDU86_006093 [Geranomyces michiganensis]
MDRRSGKPSVSGSGKVMSAAEFERILENEKTTTRITLSSERGHPTDDGYHSDASIDRALTSPSAFFNYVSSGQPQDQASNGGQQRPHQQQSHQQPPRQQQQHQNQQQHQQQQQSQSQSQSQFSQPHQLGGRSYQQPQSMQMGGAGATQGSQTRAYPGVIPSRTHPVRSNSGDGRPMPPQQRPSDSGHQVQVVQPQHAHEPQESVQMGTPPPGAKRGDTKSLADFLRNTGPDENPFVSQAMKTKKKKNSFFGFGKKKKDPKEADAKRGFPPMETHVPLKVAYDPFKESRVSTSQSNHSRHSENPRYSSPHAHHTPNGDHLNIPSHISNREVRRSIIIAEDEGRFGPPLIDVGSLERRISLDRRTSTDRRRRQDGEGGSPRSPHMRSSPLSYDGDRDVHPQDIAAHDHRRSRADHAHLSVIRDDAHHERGRSSPSHQHMSNHPRSSIPNRLLADDSLRLSSFNPGISEHPNLPIIDQSSAFGSRFYQDYRESEPQQRVPDHNPNGLTQTELSQQQYFNIMKNDPRRHEEAEDDDDWSDGEGNDYGFDGDDDDFDDYDDLDDETLANTEVNAAVNYGLQASMAMAHMQPQKRPRRDPKATVVFSSTMEECVGAEETSDGEIEYGALGRETVPMRDRREEPAEDEASTAPENKAPLVIKSRGSSLAYVKDRDASSDGSDYEAEAVVDVRDRNENMAPPAARSADKVMLSENSVAMQTPPDTPRMSNRAASPPTAERTTLTNAAQRNASLPPSDSLPMPTARVVSMSLLPAAPVSTTMPPPNSDLVSAAAAASMTDGPVSAASGTTASGTSAAVSSPSAPRRKKVRHVQIQTRTPATTTSSTQTAEQPPAAPIVSPELQQENTALLAEVVRLRALVHNLTHDRDNERDQFDVERERFNALSENAVKKIKELCREVEVYKVEIGVLKGVVEGMEREQGEWGLDDAPI